ncbi:MAG TPA: hypothetical protein GX693_06825 [Firmicutes bacterium]|nr:hypothetical protein [Bacillota bacterium]
MNKKKKPRSSKKTLIVVLAAVVAVGMVLSTVIIYIDYIRKPNYTQKENADQESFERQLQAEHENLKQEARQLEKYIEDYGPSPAVLDRLASIYSGLAEYARWLDAESRPQYLEKAAEIYRSLVEEEPQQVKYQFLLYSTYASLEQEEEAKQQVGSLKQLLEQKQAGGTLENLDRFYYALVLDEVDSDRQGALDQLSTILDTEPEDSPLYSYAKSYREQLKSGDKPSGEPTEGNSSPGN